MSGIPISQQSKFFDWQIEEIEKDRLRYLKSMVLDLKKNDRLYIGKIWGYDTSRGSLIIRFRKGDLPRLKNPFSMCYVKSSAGVTSSWNFSYEVFRRNHTEISTFSLPVFYMKNEPDEEWRYIGFQGIEPEFFNHIRLDLEDRNHPLIVLGEEDPPVKYLINLRNYVNQNPEDSFLNLSVRYNPKNWNPTLMGQPDVVLSEALTHVNENNLIIIQGPPGTGKTHLIAGICKHFLALDKKVCVTALTNKALMEVAEKPGLKTFLGQHRIFKTNLSGDEQKAINGLQYCENPGMPFVGGLILSSYYKLSDLLANIRSLTQIYDIIIIEEASQAFLATIAGFARLGKKVIIVGDIKQLTPIIVSENNASRIDQNINGIIEGLKTVSNNYSPLSYRMRYTYRLSDQAAKQTGEFYNHSLVSVSPLEEIISFASNFKHLFCEKGGTSLLKISIAHEGKRPITAIKVITEVVKDIRIQNPDFTIAILTPFKMTSYAIYDHLMHTGIDVQEIIIETIDRIQGLTCDVSIILIPFDGVAFAFQENRFNVSTSRAKRGTLLITDPMIDMLQSPTVEVKNYLASCKIVG